MTLGSEVSIFLLRFKVFFSLHTTIVPQSSHHLALIIHLSSSSEAVRVSSECWEPTGGQPCAECLTRPVSSSIALPKPRHYRLCRSTPSVAGPLTGDVVVIYTAARRRSLPLQALCAVIPWRVGCPPYSCAQRHSLPAAPARQPPLAGRRKQFVFAERSGSRSHELVARQAPRGPLGTQR